MKSLPAVVALLSASVLSAQSPLDTFAISPANNGLTAGSGIYFDLNVQASQLITDIAIETTTTTSGLTLEVWTCAGTYTVEENNPAAWTLVSTGTSAAAGAGGGALTPIDVADFLLQPGLTGIYLVYTNMDLRYFGNNSAPPPAAVSTAEVTLTTGGSSGSLTPGGGVSNRPRMFTGQIAYQPGMIVGLTPLFSADVRSGPSPLAVTFTDLSLTDDPAGISLVEWDFENDGIFDATGSTASNSYGCGNWSVTMQVTDSLNGSASLTETDYITVDSVSFGYIQDADVTAVGTPVNFFANAQTGATIEWDFESDGIIDTNNPVASHAYQAPGFYTVTGRATLGCSTATQTSTVEVLADAILAPGGSSLLSFASPPDVAYFDIQVLNPNGQLVQEILHRNPNTSDSTTVEVYIQSVAGRSVVGNEAASNFTLVASGTGTSPGVSNRVFAIDVTDFVLPPGVTGMAVVSTAGGQTFWDNSRGFTNSNADVAITNHSADSDFLAAGNNLTEMASWAGGFITNAVNDLFVEFGADVLTGNSPLAVQFTDLSVTNAPAGVASWAWDFQNDGTVDSTQRNPSFTYSSCGDFDVSLTATDALNGSRTELKTAFIATDVFTASFTQSQEFGSIGDTVAFNYTGGSGVTLAWDLDGDGVTDSTSSNPSFTYSASGTFTVTLDATRNCRTETSQSTVTIVDAILDAPVGSGSFTSFFTPPDCSYFDLQINNPMGITVTAVGFRSPNVGAPHDIEVWTKSGTALNNFANSNYSLVATGTATPTISNELFIVDVNDFSLATGLHGMVVVSRNSGTAHTWYQSNAGQVASDTNISMTPQGSDTNFSTQTSNTNVSSLTNSFSGAVIYTVGGMAAPPGTVAKFGDGCTGSLGIPTLQTGISPPQTGGTFAVRIENVSGAASLHGGVSNTFNSTFGIPLPADLGPLLGTQAACRFQVSSELILPPVLADPFANADVSLSIPNNPSFSGLTVYFQAAVFDGAVQGGLVVSDAWFGVIL